MSRHMSEWKHREHMDKLGLTFTREQQIGTEFVIVHDKQSDAVAYIYNSRNNGKPAAAVFYGKQNKPISRHYYTNELQRELAVVRAFEARRLTAQWKADRRKEMSIPHTLKVGDILSGSWGYDQTNIDFFEVVATTEHGVTVRRLAQKKDETGYMTGSCVPIPGKYISDPTIHRCSAGNCIKSPVHGSASQWDGKPERWSSYA